MNVVILKTPHSKAIIGFTEDLKTFIEKWMKNRSQFSGLMWQSNTKCTFIDEDKKIHSIYSSELKDNETCWISCNDNLMGFNDNH